MQKFNLAITIRSFTLSEYVVNQLEPFFTITSVNREGKRLSESEVIQAITGADAVIAGTEPFSREVIRRSPRLKVISRVGVGIDSVDLDEVRARNIRLLNTPSSAIEPVAEHAVALILALLKRVTEYTNAMRGGDHSVRKAGLLKAKTVGIVGLGRIGHRVGELLSGFGCSIIYYDPALRFSPPGEWKRAMTLDDLVRNADIITLHAPAQNGNVPLLDRETLNRCREGVLIVNTARGSLIDEEALAGALKSGRVAGAGLDVFSKEPYTGPLLQFPQVLVTPHVASNTSESRDAMEREAVDNLIVSAKEMSE